MTEYASRKDLERIGIGEVKVFDGVSLDNDDYRFDGTVFAWRINEERVDIHPARGFKRLSVPYAFSENRLPSLRNFEEPADESLIKQIIG